MHRSGIGKRTLGVAFVEHVKGRYLGVPQVSLGVRVEHAQGQRLCVVSVGPDVLATLAHHDCSASVLASRQHHTSRNVGLAHAMAMSDVTGMVPHVRINAGVSCRPERALDLASLQVRVREARSKQCPRLSSSHREL